MESKAYLEQALTKLQSPSQADFARAIGVDRAAITRYLDGTRTMDDYTASKVAEILNMNPMTIIAQANAEREKDEKKRNYWRKFAAAVSVALLVNFILPGAQNMAVASTTYSGSSTSNTHYGGFRILTKLAGIFRNRRNQVAAWLAARMPFAGSFCPG